MRITVEMLRTFCVVVECGSLAEAANRLGRTQSALSMTLSQLSAHFGQKLFEGDRKNSLTLTGQQIFNVATQQVNRFDLAVLEMERTAKSPGAFLRISSVPSVASLILPSAVGCALKAFPDLRIALSDATSAQVRSRLINGETDVGILSHDFSLNKMQQVLLFHDSYGLVCAPDHPLLADEQSLSMEMLERHPFVWNDLIESIDEDQIGPLSKHSRLTIHNTLSLLTYVRSEKAATILPQAASLVLSGELSFVKLDHLIAPRQVCLYYPRKLAERADLQHLVQEIRGAADTLADTFPI